MPQSRADSRRHEVIEKHFCCLLLNKSSPPPNCFESTYLAGGELGDTTQMWVRALQHAGEAQNARCRRWMFEARATSSFLAPIFLTCYWRKTLSVNISGGSKIRSFRIIYDHPQKAKTQTRSMYSLATCDVFTLRRGGRPKAESEHLRQTGVRQDFS